MPPRKKARVESQATSTASAEPPIAQDKTEVDSQAFQTSELDPELWTDEQEIALFKGMIKWKPVGMHKHYRMIALSQYMRSHGHRELHTRPQGIWRKLDSLYNLKTLDEREDAFGDGGLDDMDLIIERFCDFKLPDEEFASLMFDRRFEKHKSSSPGVLSGTVEGRSSTVDDTEEPRSSPASSFRGARSSRRGRYARSTRGRSKLQKESTPQGKAKASSEPSAEEKDTTDEEEDDEEDDEDEDEEEADEDEGNQTPTLRGSRGRGRGRSRGRGGRRGRKRG